VGGLAVVFNLLLPLCVVTASVDQMSEAIALEFDFPEVTADRQRSTLARVWELRRKWRDVESREGSMIPCMLAAKVLDVSRSRVDQLVGEGRLKRVEVDGHVFISEDSIVALAKEERRVGRPVKKITERDLLKSSFSSARELLKKS